MVGAAAYLAVLAFPDSIEERDKFLTALQRSIARGRTKKAVLRDDRRRIDRTLERIRTRRVPAGNAANALYPNGQQIGPIRFRGEFANITRLATHASWLDDIPRHKDASNFLPQVWKDSWPVLHMAMAFNLQAGKFIVPGSRLNLLTVWLQESSLWLLPAMRVAAGHLLEMPRFVRGYDSRCAILLLPEEADPTLDLLKSALDGKIRIELPFSNVTG